MRWPHSRCALGLVCPKPLEKLVLLHPRVSDDSSSTGVRPKRDDGPGEGGFGRFRGRSPSHAGRRDFRCRGDVAGWRRFLGRCCLFQCNSFLCGGPGSPGCLLLALCCILLSLGLGGLHQLLLARGLLRELLLRVFLCHAFSSGRARGVPRIRPIVSQYSSQYSSRAQDLFWFVRGVAGVILMSGSHPIGAVAESGAAVRLGEGESEARLLLLEQQLDRDAGALDDAIFAARQAIEPHGGEAPRRPASRLHLPAPSCRCGAAIRRSSSLRRRQCFWCS